MTERFPPAAVALFGAAVYLLLGFISTEELFAVFSNPAPVTIGALFVVSSALVRTGVVEAVTNQLVERARGNAILTLALMMVGTILVSAVMNNTPVVMVLIPVVIKVASAAGLAPTQLLIPISYAAVLGGTWTLIGTSSNLLVDGLPEVPTWSCLEFSRSHPLHWLALPQGCCFWFFSDPCCCQGELRRET